MINLKIFKCSTSEHSTRPTKQLKLESLKENVPPELSGYKELEKNIFCDESGDLSLSWASQSSNDRQIKRTPKKCSPTDDGPVTPNTNIKLLTTVASTQAYANCSTPKSRNSKQSPASFDTEETHPVARVNRKEKSLGIICIRFLSLYPLYPNDNSNMIVSLDDVSAKLKIERRRLYDIVNVFESIDMLKKLAKNKYLWFGKVNLLPALHKIKVTAEKENVSAKLLYVLNQQKEDPDSKQSCILDEVQVFNKKFETENSTQFSSIPSQTFPELRKDKSLSIMSQKFLMLFLVSPYKTISLGVAAKVLNGFQRAERAAQIKTQIRRLYDIANVLSSIGLIQKEVTIVQNGRKPAFKYIGPDLKEFQEIASVDSIQMNNFKTTNSIGKSRSLVRHSSFQEICAVAEIEHQKLCLRETSDSAPPFENSMLKKIKIADKTTFTDLNLNNNVGTKILTNQLNDFKEDFKCFSTLKDIQLKKSNENIENSNPQLKSSMVHNQSSVKVINVPKQMFTKNGSYYILNPSNGENSESSNSVGTLLLINPSLSAKPTENIGFKTELKIPTSQTMNLSKAQCDSIFQSLNISLSDGQIAAIQLEGISKPIASSYSPRRNLLKIIEKTEVSDMPISQSKSMETISNGIYTNNEKGNELSSTRNSSPSNSTGRFDSPVSIPSNYVTPIPTPLSDLSFLSNSETGSVLKNIESEQIQTSEMFDILSKEQERLLDKYSVQGEKLETFCSAKKEIQLQPKNHKPFRDIQNFPAMTNSGSNDSFNSEVSEILKGKQLGEDSSKMKSFLIDEKTILSPIKRKEEMKTSVVSPLLTPPYFPSDSAFMFDNAMLKIPSLSQISKNTNVETKVSSLL